MRRGRASQIGALAAAAIVFATPASRAADVGNVVGKDLVLDVTETTIVAQHFDARGGELPQDSGWGEWLNRLNAALRWGNWTAGLRIDSQVYWRRPIDNPNFGSLTPPNQAQVVLDNESRFRTSVYPSKVWATFASRGVEVTVGDSYVQFGRGLVLLMRKIDDLGVDTTLRGVKARVEQDSFAVTAVAGFGNPSRVDEATGRALFVSVPAPGDMAMPMFGSDRIVGAEIQAGRGLPVVLATHAVQVARCAPYAYDAGRPITNFGADPSGVLFGTCNPSDTAIWLASLPNDPTSLNARDITMMSESLEVPDLWGHGKLYVEAALQQRMHDNRAEDLDGNGNAIYSALSLDAGPAALTFELKSNRNFYAVPAAINLSRASEFIADTYSFLPPAETFNQIDTEFGNFNACVDGGRLRGDYRVGKSLMLWAQGVYAYTKSEQNAECDAHGNTIGTPPAAAASVQNRVWDGVGGFEWYFDAQSSHVYASVGARDDTKATGEFFYRELHAEYSIVKWITGPVSIEIQGRHRLRKEASTNLEPVGDTYVEQWWHEGENYVALKVAPKWVFTQGFEYTTLIGQPTYYVNGGAIYKFTSGSNVRLFVGQQRGAFRCTSGACRYFPPFEGAEGELTLRF